MTDALTKKFEIEPHFRPQRRRWPTVCSRAEWRSNSLDEPRRLRPEGHRHRLSSPDGIVVDVEAGHIYWTNMGFPI